MSSSAFSAKAILDAIFNATSFSVTTPYLSLHTGPPRWDGRDEVAGGSYARQAGSFAAAIDMVQNGTFATDTIWTKGTGWTIAAGVASCSGAQGADSDLEQDIPVVQGNKHVVEFTVSGYSAGNVTPVLGDTEGTDRSANGTYIEEITVGAGTTLRFKIRADLNFVGNVDNVTVSGAYVDTDTTEQFTGMPATTVTHVGIWDAATAGNFVWGGALIASKSPGAGDTLEITSGDLYATQD